MRIRLTGYFWLALAIHLPAGAAVTVIECVDASGDSSFADKCPPGTTKKSEKTIRGVGGSDDPSIDDIAAANPITMYSVPDCDACGLVRNLLNTRNLPFTEKNVQDSAEMQEELKAVTGGLTVPATKIGTNISTGYSRSAIDNALEQAGYPKSAE